MQWMNHYEVIITVLLTIVVTGINFGAYYYLIPCTQYVLTITDALGIPDEYLATILLFALLVHLAEYVSITGWGTFSTATAVGLYAWLMSPFTDLIHYARVLYFTVILFCFVCYLHLMEHLRLMKKRMSQQTNTTNILTKQ